MKDKYLFYLTLSYLFLFGIMLLVSVYSPISIIRTLLLLIAFTPVVILHLIFSCCSNTDNIKFYILSFLWGIKYVVFALSEGISFFSQKMVLYLDWIDLYLLHIIALFVGVSFILQIPFWYRKSAGKIYILVGIVLLAISVIGTIAISLAFIDYLKK